MQSLTPDSLIIIIYETHTKTHFSSSYDESTQMEVLKIPFVASIHQIQTWSCSCEYCQVTQQPRVGFD